MWNVGQKVRITSEDPEWHGLECEVLGYNKMFPDFGPHLQPLRNRPDEFGNSPFFWDVQQIESIIDDLPTPDTYEVD